MTVKKIDPTRPFYAVVGAGDLAVELARGYTADVSSRMAEVQARVAKLDLEPTVLRDQARTAVGARIDGLNVTEARNTVESYFNEAVAEVTETYGDLAARGRELVARIRRQQATRDAGAAAQTATAKAKTTRTQTARSARSTAETAKRSAKKTGATAKRNVKATTTAAQNTAEVTTQAVSDAAEKVDD